MNASPPLAKIAFLIGEPARALMLAALMDGRSRTAGELARVSGVTAQTASSHLAKLVEACLIVIERQGRHRYHRLASAEVATALEALMTVAAPSTHALGPSDAALRYARSCYDHMAGEVAVRVTDLCLAKGWITADEPWTLTEHGQHALIARGLEAPDPRSRRPIVRPCLDWSERRPHLGGQLGAHLLNLFLAKGWVKRQPHSRVLTVTASGERALRSFE